MLSLQKNTCVIIKFKTGIGGKLKLSFVVNGMDRSNSWVSKGKQAVFSFIKVFVIVSQEKDKKVCRKSYFGSYPSSQDKVIYHKLIVQEHGHVVNVQLNTLRFFCSLYVIPRGKVNKLVSLSGSFN